MLLSKIKSVFPVIGISPFNNYYFLTFLTKFLGHAVVVNVFLIQAEHCNVQNFVFKITMIEV